MPAHALIGPEGGHVAGRQLLEKLYREKTGQALPEIAIGPRGKPYFVGSDLHFSITHTKHHVFCVLSDAPVGVDAEECDRRVSPKLAQKILSPGEMQRYLTAEDPNAALLRLWVLKEALGKCTGTGITQASFQTDFSPEDPRIQILHGCYVAVIANPFRRGGILPALSDGFRTIPSREG